MSDIKSEYSIDQDTGQRYVWTKLGGGKGADGNPIGLVGAEITKDTSTKPQSWKFTDGGTIANGGAAQTTADVSMFLPFDTLTFAEDGAASVTWDLQLRPGSKGVIVVTGTGTLLVTGNTKNGGSASLTVSTSAGVKQVASTLAAGTYYIEV